MKKTTIERGPIKARLSLTIAAALAISILGGCGGGDAAPSNPGTPVSNVAPTQMTGTVAVGSPVSGAIVTVLDENGATASATSDASGNYSVSLAGLSAPFAIVASDPSGVDPVLVSVVSSLPTGSGAPVVANVTTLTSAVAALLTTSGNPLDVAASGNLASIVTPATVAAAVTKLNTALAPILSANGLAANSFDPIGAPFSANQSGADAVIDTVKLVDAPTGGTQLVSTADTSTGITLNQGASAPTPLQVPPAPADFLAPLMAKLAQCLGGDSASCAQAIDSNYRDNGFTSFAAAHPGLSASGVTLRLPQTLKFFMSSGRQEALVLLPYTTPSGASGTGVTMVQKTADGTWDIIGNQEPYNVTITSFLDRRIFVDPTNQPYGRYEAGIGISIPAGAAGTPNPTNLAAASVTGPGINGTAYLLPRSASGNDVLALTGNQLTHVPTGGVTSGSNTSLYRWSWHALPGANGTYVPATNNLGFVTPAPIDVSSVPHFSTYTVTFYDSTGAQIGQPFSVMNATPTLGWTAGTAVRWQTLSPSTISAFLNPTGSLAGAQSAVNLAWSNLVDGYNIAPVAMKVQIQAVPGAGVTPPTEVDGWWDGPATFSHSGQYSASATAGVDQSGVQQCSSPCQFPVLSAGGSRIAQLYWTLAQTAYYNIWKYTDVGGPT